MTIFSCWTTDAKTSCCSGNARHCQLNVLAVNSNFGVFLTVSMPYIFIKCWQNDLRKCCKDHQELLSWFPVEYCSVTGQVLCCHWTSEQWHSYWTVDIHTGCSSLDKPAGESMTLHQCSTVPPSPLRRARDRPGVLASSEFQFEPELCSH